MKKIKIEVREKGEYLRPSPVIETIYRKPWLESIRNFNPMFCRYKGKRKLVHSQDGDVSDPFRREESYFKTLYIEIDPATTPSH